MDSKLRIHHDKEGDFLEIGLGEPKSSYSEYIGDDTFEIRDRETDEVIGYSFYNVSKQEKVLQDLEIEIPKARV